MRRTILLNLPAPALAPAPAPDPAPNPDLLINYGSKRLCSPPQLHHTFEAQDADLLVLRSLSQSPF